MNKLYYGDNLDILRRPSRTSRLIWCTWTRRSTPTAATT